MPAFAISNRYGGWLPHSSNVYQHFLNEHLKKATDKKRANLKHVPSVLEFERAIKADPVMVSLFNDIFLQVSPEYTIPDFETLLYAIDDVVIAPPRFYVPPGGGDAEPIGVPLYLLFDLPANTAAGYDLFRMRAFNIAMKNLLDSWGAYLTTEDSNKTLTEAEDGWFGKAGIASLEIDRGIFNKTYITPDPTAVNRGYKSWDKFFVREVQPSARPIDLAGDKSLIHNACESRVYRIAKNVKAHDSFWLKTQAYSLYDMLKIGADRDAYVDAFVGGTVYQAFLSPQDYHRWRSPIDGVIEKAVVIPGTYYAALPDDGEEIGAPNAQEDNPRGALVRSQAWLTMNAARALIFIRAANPVIGLVCFIGVGMVEVSTCSLSIKEGDRVKTGDELGMFHFGGSTHTLIFGPQVNVTFADNVVVGKHIWVNSIIAQVSAAIPPTRRH